MQNVCRFIELTKSIIQYCNAIIEQLFYLKYRLSLKLYLNVVDRVAGDKSLNKIVEQNTGLKHKKKLKRIS